ncbi:membrane protein insertase YidC [Mycoplasmopsis cricetuli]|uniref:membrane protein insertase YidC n=1 Tax=Mycoplasmopsis cricetuli TaxID=171283 RepID=UPI000470AB7B|nr:membrane protein insertase YidC [Mycoplasmopsis cricetuli]
MKRSKHFNYFTKSKDPVERRNKVLKKIWKWLRVAFYIIIAGISLTGCIQSFVIKTSTNTGAGLEFTNGKEKISPKVTNLEEKEITLQLPNNNSSENKEEFKIKTLQVNTSINHNISDQNTLNNLAVQINGTNNDKGYFRKDNSFTSAISISNNNEPIYQKNGNYLAAAIAGPKANKINDIQDYKFVNEIKDIYFFNFYANIKENNADFIRFIKKEKDNDNKTTISTVGNSANIINEATLNNEGKYEIVWTSGLAKIDNLQSQDLSSDPNKKIVNKFNRDVLQLFYDYTFNKESQFYKTFNKDPGEFLKEKIDEAKAKNIYKSQTDTVLFTLTPKEAVLVKEYIRLVYNWLTATGYIWKNGKIIQSSLIENLQSNVSNDILNGDGSTKYNYNENIYSIGKDVKTLAYQDSVPLLNISSWGEAWTYGPFYGLFVYPATYLINALSHGIGVLNGWGTIIVLFLVTFIIRFAVFCLTFKSTAKSSVQEELKSKKAAIELKYSGFENNKAMKARKAQELQALNKKYNINMFDTIASQIITIPIFLTMWRAIQIIPIIKSTNWIGINFGSTSWSKVTEGEWIYISVIAISIIVQLVSQLIPSLLNRRRFKERTSIAEQQALKKQEKTQRITIILFTVIVVFFSAGVQIYWIITGLFTLLQHLFMHKIKKTKWFKDKYSLKSLSRK